MRPPFDLATYFAGQIYQAAEEASRVYEPMIGIVTDNKDPDKLGRVKVKFPVLSEQDTSWWAPIIMMGAGKNRGWFFIPEKDDEVLCMFEHGDISRPLVVGALWNGKDKAPDKNPGGNPRRVIKSRAGSKLTLDDDQMKIILEDGSGKGKITFDSNGNKIQIEALVGDVAFMTPKDETKIVAQKIEIKATSNIEIHSGKAMQWGANNVTINGSGGVTMSGSKVNLNCGNAQSPTAPTADPQDIADPYEARGSSQQAQQGQQQPQQSPPPPTSTSTTSSTPPPSEQDAQEDEQSEQQQEQKEEKPEEKEHFALWLDVEAINGGKLSGNTVSIIDPKTKEVVGKAEIDDDGKIHAPIPENKPYHIKIDDDAPVIPPEETATTSAHDIAHLSVNIYDSTGAPIKAGTEITIKGGPDNVSITTHANAHGGLDPIQLGDGAYELHVEGEVFTAHTLRKVDLDHKGAAPYEFQLGHEEGEPDYDELQREHRISKADLAELE